MADKQLNKALTSALLLALEETFEDVKGIYLDRQTSIMETLATITAEEASRPVSTGCATIAAHVAHMTYYIEILLQLIGGQHPETDWQYVWQTVSTVSTDEWTAVQQALADKYQQIQDVVAKTEWQDDRKIGGALGLLMHNAYHLGEIRHALCTIKAMN